MKSEVKNKILLVDDDADILDLLEYNFKKDGYQVEVESNGARAAEVALSFQPDLIILDIMMPGVNGIDVCRKVRALPGFEHTYIFFLTAKSNKDLQSLALGTGGDDYIEKITGLRALMHKVRTVLKKDLVIRKREKEIRLGDLFLDRSRNAIKYKSRAFILPKDEFEFLYFFAQNPGKIITQKNVLNNIWGSDVYVFKPSLESYISSISEKAGAHLIARTAKGQYKLAVK